MFKEKTADEADLSKVFWKKFVLGTILWILACWFVTWAVGYFNLPDLVSGIALVVVGAGLYLWNFVFAVLSVVTAFKSSVSGWLKACVTLICLFDLACLMMALLYVVHKVFIN